MFYIVLAAHSPVCYGPYSTEAAANADARRLFRATDYYADVFPAAKVAEVESFYAGHGQRLEHRTAMLPA